jgi:undecaprenyl-phosphate galactose phosphotransferase
MSLLLCTAISCISSHLRSFFPQAGNFGIGWKLMRQAHLGESKKRRKTAMKSHKAVHNIPAAPISFYTFLGIVRRLSLMTGQAILDAALYWVCLCLVASFWDIGTFDMWGERKLFFCGVLLICFFFNSLYQFKAWMFWDEIREVSKSSITALLLIAAYLFALKLHLSRLLVFTSVAFFVPACLLGRYLYRRAAVAAGFLKTPVLIIGAGKAGELYAKKAAAYPFMGCKIMGFLDDDPLKMGSRVAGVPVLGRLEDFAEAQRTVEAEEVVVAISTASRELLSHILDIIGMRVKRVSYIPDMYMLTTFSATIRDVDGLVLISASQGLLNPVNKAIKSFMDYSGAILALILFSPVFLYVAWKIKKDDGGDVFFNRYRTGQNLLPFKMYKFRTMLPGAEDMLKEMLKDENLRQEYEVAYKFKNDPRVTRVGNFLRKSSLDELPQIFNVLRGEMSLVGPRPFLKEELHLRYGNMAAQIYRVKPGLTGLWQVSGRNDIADYQQSREFDLYYIYNWSPWLDIVILLRTIQVLLNRTGAY